MEGNFLKTFGVAAPEILFGIGTIEQLGMRVKGLGAEKVLVITDEGVAAAGILARVLGTLERSGVSCGVFDKVEKEPSVENVESAFQAASGKSYQLLIGLGGGSSIDVTKMASVLMKHGGEIRNYFGLDKVPGRGLPTIYIPTTAGTGSEVSRFAIFDDRKAKTKLGAVSRHLMADLALIDPVLTATMPPSVTASTGADAFIHAVEGYVAVNASPFSDVLGLEAVRIIYEYLPVAYADGANMQARYWMAYGSMLGGLMLNLAGASSSHALAYPIGSQYHVPHGVGCMLTFLEVMEYFAMADIPKFCRMAQAMGVRTESMSPREAAEQAVVEMRRLAEYIEIPHKLSAIKMDKSLIEPFAKSVVANQQRLLTNGPRKLSEKDIRTIYERSY
ncbi:MAG: Alcohol dehydrogenase [Syntrophaceae bacterium PtaU1.Bin231]|nr:MAG: Alcohol dehydrogenase [Syntrophaceae bacterium PtaU1.Bin231]HOG17266.1 iron-containing alcohol dehydrogenase [Syntrophales bacterium]